MINKTEYQETEDWAVELQENLLKGQAGSLVLHTDSGKDILLDYRPLSVDGWFLATLIPKDILSSEVDRFISRTFAITVLLVALFLTLLIATISMQNRYRSKIEKMSFYDPVTGAPAMSICNFRRKS